MLNKTRFRSNENMAKFLMRFLLHTYTYSDVDENIAKFKAREF
jgi:hypothetical protein